MRQKIRMQNWFVLVFALIVPLHSFAGEPAANLRSSALDAEPMRFERNRGQTSGSYDFLLRGRGFSVGTSASGFTMQTATEAGSHGDTLQVRWLHALERVPAEGERENPYRVHYWQFPQSADSPLLDVPTYEAVRYRGVYPGIDVLYHAAAREMEYDFIVSAAANPDLIRFSIEGASSIVIDENGSLLLHTRNGTMMQRKPVAYQEVDGERRPVQARYVSRGESSFGFEVGAYDKHLPLVIDPVVERALFFGGDQARTVLQVLVDAAGDLYLVSEGFLPLPADPADRSALSPMVGDAYTVGITKIKADFSAALHTVYLPVAYSTQAYDRFALDVSPEGEIAFATNLWESNLATQVTAGPYGHARDPRVHTRNNAQTFVVRIAADGRTLRFSTILACEGASIWQGIRADHKGNTLVLARMTGTRFPFTEGAYGSSTPDRAQGETFLIRLSPSGDLAYSARLTNLGYGTPLLTVDRENRPVLAGTTTSAMAPIPASGYSQKFAGYSEGYILVLKENGSGVEAGTYIGGAGSDSLSKLHIAHDGSIYASLQSNIGDLPATPNAFEQRPRFYIPNHFNPVQSFLAKFSADLTKLLYGSYTHIGEMNTTFLADSDDRLYLLGQPAYLQAPPSTIGALFARRDDFALSYMARLSTDLSSVDYATYMPIGNPLPSTRIAMLPRRRMLIARSESSGRNLSDGEGSLKLTDPVGIRTPGAEPTKGPVHLSVYDLASATLCLLSANPLVVEVPPTGATGELSLSVASGCPSYATVDWSSSSRYHLALTLDTSWGYGNRTIAYEVAANDSSVDEKETTVFAGPNSIKFRQKPATCDVQSLSASTLSFTSQGGEQALTFTIPLGCAWQTISTAPWLRFSYGSGSSFTQDSVTGNGKRELYVVADPNSFGSRTGAIRMGNMQVAVSQMGGACTATLTPAQTSVPSSGGKATFQLATTADCDWQARLTAGATFAGATNGSGSSSIVVEIPTNTTTESKAFSLHVASRVATITQPPSPCNFVFRPESIAVSRNAGSYQFDVTATGAGCTYVPRATEPWIKVDSHASSGNGWVRFSVQANTSPTGRSGYIELFTGRFRIDQDSADTGVSISFATAPPGGTVKVNGVERTTPYTFLATEGASMQLEATLHRPRYASTRWTFFRWQHGQARTHTITAPTANTTFTAEYRLEHRINTAVQGVGSIQMSPSSGDGFYVYGESVMLTALPGKHHIFMGWEGDITAETAASNPLRVSVDGAKTLKAIFLPDMGADAEVTVAPPTVALHTGGAQPDITKAHIQLSSTTPMIFTNLTLDCGGRGHLVNALIEINEYHYTGSVDVSLLPSAIAGLPVGNYFCALRMELIGQEPPIIVTIPISIELHRAVASTGTIRAAVNGASFVAGGLAPGSIVSLFGEGLSDGEQLASTIPLPEQLQNTQVVLEIGGVQKAMPLFYVSPTQLNVLVPEGLPYGQGILRLRRQGIETSQFDVSVQPIAPAIFTANSNGSGSPAGHAVRARGAEQVKLGLFSCGQTSGSCQPTTIEWGGEDEDVVLVLFGTGFRNLTAERPAATVDGILLDVAYAGPQGDFLGLDQINIRLPRRLRGTGQLNLVLTHAGMVANSITLWF